MKDPIFPKCPVCGGLIRIDQDGDNATNPILICAGSPKGCGMRITLAELLATRTKLDPHDRQHAEWVAVRAHLIAIQPAIDAFAAAAQQAQAVDRLVGAIDYIDAADAMIDHTDVIVDVLVGVINALLEALDAPERDRDVTEDLARGYLDAYNAGYPLVTPITDYSPEEETVDAFLADALETAKFETEELVASTGKVQAAWMRRKADPPPAAYDPRAFRSAMERVARATIPKPTTHTVAFDFPAGATIPSEQIPESFRILGDNYELPLKTRNRDFRCTMNIMEGGLATVQRTHPESVGMPGNDLLRQALIHKVEEHLRQGGAVLFVGNSPVSARLRDKNESTSVIVGLVVDHLKAGGRIVFVAGGAPIDPEVIAQRIREHLMTGGGVRLRYHAEHAQTIWQDHLNGDPSSTIQKAIDHLSVGLPVDLLPADMHPRGGPITAPADEASNPDATVDDGPQPGYTVNADGQIAVKIKAEHLPPIERLSEDPHPIAMARDADAISKAIDQAACEPIVCNAAKCTVDGPCPGIKDCTVLTCVESGDMMDLLAVIQAGIKARTALQAKHARVAPTEKE